MGLCLLLQLEDDKHGSTLHSMTIPVLHELSVEKVLLQYKLDLIRLRKDFYECIDNYIPRDNMIGR